MKKIAVIWALMTVCCAFGKTPKEPVRYTFELNDNAIECQKRGSGSQYSYYSYDRGNRYIEIDGMALDGQDIKALGTNNVFQFFSDDRTVPADPTPLEKEVYMMSPEYRDKLAELTAVCNTLKGSTVVFDIPISNNVSEYDLKKRGFKIGIPYIGKFEPVSKRCIASIDGFRPVHLCISKNQLKQHFIKEESVPLYGTSYYNQFFATVSDPEIALQIERIAKVNTKTESCTYAIKCITHFDVVDGNYLSADEEVPVFLVDDIVLYNVATKKIVWSMTAGDCSKY